MLYNIMIDKTYFLILDLFEEVNTNKLLQQIINITLF